MRFVHCTYIHFAHWGQNCQKCSGAPATPWLSGKMTKTDVAYNSKVVGGRWSFKKNFVRSYFFFRVHFIVHFTSQRIISATKVVVKGLISVPHCPFIGSLFFIVFLHIFFVSQFVPHCFLNTVKYWRFYLGNIHIITQQKVFRYSFFFVLFLFNNKINSDS